MIPYKHYGLLAIVSLMWIVGCSSPYVENNMIEEIAPVVFWSIDKGTEGKFKISTLVPPLIKEKKRFLSKEVDLLKQGGKEFNLIYYRELKQGQLRMLLINEELAKEGGIEKLINTILVDPDISMRVYLLIVRGDFDEYIKNQLTKQENQDYFLYRMLKHYEEHNQGEMSIVNIHQFMKMLYSPLKDPIVPVFHADKNNFNYVGTAFFRNDKEVMVTQDVSDEIFQLLDNDHFLKVLAIPKLSISLGRVRSNIRMKLSSDYSSLSLHVGLKGRIEEYQGEKNIQSEEPLEHLIHEIEVYLEEQTSELLKSMQRLKVDPLEVGTHSLKPFSKELTEEQWLKYWGNMKINVDFDIKIQPLINVERLS
ncbi:MULTISPECIES: Ger(x)C family spore germination C-terminal domain-containing protein [unclassified Paenibacillus]|uniref:Ger(x)C family spore germination protein n=1 Tax=unclassified Paenibacillus TaxID=185978 RepID=UPI0008B81960|nr:MULTISPECIES: Ger(x)C family spore germination C-terminal domain-containing protein [unclassified Paenibacillus]QLG40319.1 spore gernimation protein [Paenibacillus sp. E222]SEN75108.1 spore germination protein [Paenibacillus sp. OK076]